MDLEGPVPGIPDAVVRMVADLPDHLSESEPAGFYMTARRGELLLAVPGVGRYLVRDGKTIDVALEPSADPGAAALFLQGSARGALIHQRGELPLHAATLVPPGDGNAVAICGISGAGKSTLAAALSRRGWILLADDTTRVTWSGTHAIAWPSGDRIKLWRDACAAAGIDTGGLDPVAATVADKFYVNVPASKESIELGTIVELTNDELDPAYALSSGEKMALLTRHTFRPANIRPLGRTGDFARIVAQVASSCRIVQLQTSRAHPVAGLADAVAHMAR